MSDKTNEENFRDILIRYRIIHQQFSSSYHTKEYYSLYSLYLFILAPISLHPPNLKNCQYHHFQSSSSQLPLSDIKESLQKQKTLNQSFLQYRVYIVLYFQKMDTATIIKILLMGVFFTEVIVFGRFISNLRCFKNGKVMSYAMTFSGMLFLSIALLDIIPQAIANFDIYFDQSSRHITATSSLHSNSNMPLTMIIAMFTFLLIMYIDKIMIGHSHDHEYQVSFTNEPRKSVRQIHTDRNQQEQNHEHAMNVDSDQPKISENRQDSEVEEKQETNLKPFILQAGMSIHSFFECLAVGIQPTTIGVLGLASAIVVHKWAEGLTLGLIYRKQNFSKTVTNLMIVVQGLVNVLGLIVGTIILGQGNFLMAFFMSISAGTFLYISLCEVLVEQVVEMNKIKAFFMFLANFFMIFLIAFEKYSEELTEDE